LVILVSLEGTIEFVLRYPQAVPFLYRPAHVINHLKNYYLGRDRSVVQFRHDCAQYDEVLTYRLRPGHCTVVNREHTVEYSVNRAGLRDTDAALDDPAIIVIGDSIAMGWGVPAEATIASRLGALTGEKVLNAAISSYDTVRETELLRELVKPDTRTIVIAYCDNDYDANRLFTHSGVVPRRNRDEYERLVAGYERAPRYYPFKHVSALTRLVWKEMLGSREPQAAEGPPPASESSNFLGVLDKHRDLLRGRNLIVIEINGFNRNSPAFSNAVRRQVAGSDLLKDVASMHVIDASSFLTDDDYFLIDDHMRPSGHDKVAHQIAAILNGDNRWRIGPAGR
jgi:hypothetical protein